MYSPHRSFARSLSKFFIFNTHTCSREQSATQFELWFFLMEHNKFSEKPSLLSVMMLIFSPQSSRSSSSVAHRSTQRAGREERFHVAVLREFEFSLQWSLEVACSVFSSVCCSAFSAHWSWYTTIIQHKVVKKEKWRIYDVSDCNAPKKAANYTQIASLLLCRSSNSSIFRSQHLKQLRKLQASHGSEFNSRKKIK